MSKIGFQTSYSRLRYILMGGSVLAALLIISIGEWGGDEALHWEAAQNLKERKRKKKKEKERKREKKKEKERKRKKKKEKKERKREKKERNKREKEGEKREKGDI